MIHISAEDCFPSAYIFGAGKYITKEEFTDKLEQALKKRGKDLEVN